MLVGAAFVHALAGAVSPNSVSLAWIEATDRFSFRLITGTGTPSHASKHRIFVNPSVRSGPIPDQAPVGQEQWREL